jgi:hypothetical protein
MGYNVSAVKPLMYCPVQQQYLYRRYTLGLWRSYHFHAQTQKGEKVPKGLVSHHPFSLSLILQFFCTEHHNYTVIPCQCLTSLKSCDPSMFCFSGSNLEYINQERFYESPPDQGAGNSGKSDKPSHACTVHLSWSCGHIVVSLSYVLDTYS